MVFNRRLFIHVTLPALLISLLLGAVCILGIRSLNQLQSDRVRLLARDVESLQSAQELQLRLRQVRIHSVLFIIDPSPKRQAVLDEDHSQFEVALAKAREAADQPEEQQLIEIMEAGYMKYRADIDDPTKRPFMHSPTSEYLAWADAHPISPLLIPAEKVILLNRQSMTTTANENDVLIKQTQWTMLLLGILGPLAGVIGGVGVAWGLSRSYTQLRLLIHSTHAQLDQEIGSVQLSADGDFRELDQQMEMVSDRVRRIVDQVEQQRQEISRAAQLAEVGKLAASVAHEVRNPLTGVKILIEAALLPNGSHQLNLEELRMMLSQIQRVERTVQGLLNFSRPLHSNRQLIDFRIVVQQAIDSVMVQSRQRNVTVEIELPAQQVPVQADPDQLLSLVTNLLINAIDVSPMNDTIRLSVEFTSDKKVEMNIRDAGPGIAPDMADRLFVPFATGKPGGTGLGLYIARRIAEDHGGTLVGSNVPDGGAQMSLHLPLKEENRA